MTYSSYQVGELFEQIRNGLTVENDPKSGGLPITRIETIANGEIDPVRVGYSGIEIGEKDSWLLEEGDILFSHINSLSHIGKCAIYQGVPEKLIHGMNLLSFRPRKQILLPEYALYLFRSNTFKSKLARSIKPSVNQASVGIKDIQKILVDIPPLATQKHIAQVLEQADQLRKQAQQMESELNKLAQSLFLEMFGDPVTNPKKWKTTTLGYLVEITSGATPSKSNKRYWEGSFPWVSPKDMKSIEIGDAIDHINECVFAETNLKRIDEQSILIVVRGMILAHTVPIAITTAPVAINQDIKAMRVIDENLVNPRYFLACLVALREKFLGIVSTAAHGTKRIETTDLSTLTVPVPPMGLQNDYCKAIYVLREQVEASIDASCHYENLFQALMQRAFKGELTAPGSKAA